MDKEVLENRIQEVLSAVFEKVIDQRELQYTRLIEILKQGKKYCESKKVPGAFETYLKELKSGSDSLYAFSSQYVSWVQEAANKLDKQVSQRQNEQRFASRGDDSVALIAMKWTKRLVRNLGQKRVAITNRFRKIAGGSAKEYKAWNQRVPLQNLVSYHLLLRRELLTKWIDRDARIWVSASDLLNNVDGEATSYGENVVEALELQASSAKEAKESLKMEVKDAQKAIETDILDWVQKTGTVERRSGFYSDIKIQRKSRQINKELISQSEQWESALKLLADRTNTIAEFFQFGDFLQQKNKEFADDLDEYLHFLFSEPLKKLEELLSEKHSNISKSGSRDQVSFLEESRNELLQILQQALEGLGKAIEEAHLSKESERYAEQVFLKANDLTKETQFLHETDFEASPPKISNREIEWRVLVVRALKEQLLSKIQPSVQHYEEFLQNQHAEIEEIKEVIDVNFESAIELCRGEGEQGGDPDEIIEEGIERTLSKIEQVKETVQKKQEEIKLTLIENGDELVKKMLLLIRQGDSKELQVIDAKYRVKETAKGWRTKLGARWARAQDRIFLFSRFIWKKSKQYWANLQQLLGFTEEQVQEVKKADIATYLTETDAKIRELPYIYRKLFNFDVDADRRFYVSLHENFNYIKKSYESWENAFPATFATVGEKGSGKSTYLSLVLDEFFQDKKMRQLSLQKTYWTSEQLLQLLKDGFEIEHAESKEEIIEHINTSRKGNIMVLECLQNLYLRNVDGYQAIEDFMYIISETKQHVFWIVSCSRYAWNYLNVTHSLGDYFSHIMRTDMLDESQMEAVIMNRHRSSGYELIFEPDESHAKSRAYRKLLDREEEAQQYLRERYFEDMAELAEGNASIAMIFWIRSIREFDDTHCYIKPLEVTTLEMVQELKPDVLFTLAAIILHDALTPKELSAILQFETERSRLIFNQLQTRGLLQEKEGQYVINQLMYRQVLRVLKERNIIHLM